MGIYEYMEKAPIESGEAPGVSFQKKIEQTGFGISAWIIVPDDIRSVGVSLIVGGGGKGIIQSTTAPIADVKDGSATAENWPAGEVEENTSDRITNASAIRLSQTFAGTTMMTMRAQ